MPDRINMIYQYDGSLAGLLCCVFESFDKKEIPAQILPVNAEQTLLFPQREIVSDREKAQRVWKSIPKKLGDEAACLVRTAFLYGENGKELAILEFLRLGFRVGKSVCNLLSAEAVSCIQKMVLSVNNETHQMLQFLRFSEYEGSLFAVIKPKHFILPLMKDHFISRFPEEKFLIYDKSHSAILFYLPYEARLLLVDSVKLPPVEEKEALYRQLWKSYHKTIAVEARINPKCQMNHLPKRFWDCMTEFEDAYENKIQGDFLFLSATLKKNTPISEQCEGGDIKAYTSSHFSDLE